MTDSEVKTNGPDSVTSSVRPLSSGPLRGFAHLLLTLWAGSLWTICGIVAPTLFAVMDRANAGAVVGRFFATAAWLGLGIAVALVLMMRVRLWRSKWVMPLLIVAASAPVLSELALGPLMHQARAAGEMRSFALLHGASGVLFLLACVAVGALVWKVNRAE